ncbi:hypothetical protein [Paracoccus rhizosphaerae]|uniref:Uncharacterized protein n=1 Tax=Paracoccus rhizosphaerae TaxID=1133347 RepID=A0ABV6CES4_9RHOB|nr:hypothetical protein [Paracoccus rhizosphaerae]
MSAAMSITDFLMIDGWHEQPGGKVIAPNGQHVLTIHSDNMTSGEVHQAMRAVLRALADSFGEFPQ